MTMTMTMTIENCIPCGRWFSAHDNDQDEDHVMSLTPTMTMTMSMTMTMTMTMPKIKTKIMTLTLTVTMAFLFGSRGLSRRARGRRYIAKSYLAPRARLCVSPGCTGKFASHRPVVAQCK